MDTNFKCWTSAIFPSPLDVAPLRIVGFLHKVAEPEVEGFDAYDFGGYVYIDGSCYPSAIRGMSRAGCALVEVDAEGHLVRQALMLIPRQFPQIAQAAENIGYAMAMRILSRRTDLASDCLGVVEKGTGTMAKAISPEAKYSGVMLDTYRWPFQRERVDLRRVPAHRTETGGEDEATKRDIRGNNLVDELAKEAATRHEDIPAEIRSSIEWHEARAGHVLKAVGTALGLFPAAPGNLERGTRDDRMGRRRRGREGHEWEYRVGAWRCAKCASWALGEDFPKRREQEICRHGASRKQTAAEEATRQGHKLFRCDGDMPFTFCARCGAWEVRRGRMLRLPCARPTAPGKQALARIRRGKHPSNSVKFSEGVKNLKERVEVVATFDSASMAWKSDPRWRASREGRRIGGPHGNTAADGGEEREPHQTGVDEGRGNARRQISGQSESGRILSGRKQREEDPFGHGGSLVQQYNQEVRRQRGTRRPF